MSKIVSIILGILILSGSWIVFRIYGDKVYYNSTELLLLYAGFIFSVGIAYTVIHQEKYPLSTVLTLLIVQFALLKLFEDSAPSGNIRGQLIMNTIIPAMMFALIGPKLGKAFAFILSPVQKYFSKIGLRFNIPIVTGIIGFVVGCILFGSESLF